MRVILALTDESCFSKCSAFVSILENLLRYRNSYVILKGLNVVTKLRFNVKLILISGKDSIEV